MYLAQHGHNERSRLGLNSPEPIDIVREFLNRMREPHAAKEFIPEDARVECHSAMVRHEGKKDEEATQAAQGDLDDLLVSCSRYDIEFARLA